jgi:hypothetical protein
MSGLIALPCRNAELVIGSLIMRARQAADAVLVIDEGSTDRTADIVACSGTPLVTRSASGESGGGLRDAISYADRTSVDLLVVLFDDQLCRHECIARLTESVRDGSADLVIGETKDGETGLLVLNRRTVGFARSKGSGLDGPTELISAADAVGFRIRSLHITEEGEAHAEQTPGIGSNVRAVVLFAQPRAASAAYGSVCLSLGVGAAAWSLSSFNATALLHIEGLLLGAVLAFAGMLLITSSLLSDSFSLIRNHYGN